MTFRLPGPRHEEHAAGEEVEGIPRWLNDRLPIESINGEARTVTFDRPRLFALVSGSRPGGYWVGNVFEVTDTPSRRYLGPPVGVMQYRPRPGEAGGNVLEYHHVHDIGPDTLSDRAGICTRSTPDGCIAWRNHGNKASHRFISHALPHLQSSNRGSCGSPKAHARSRSTSGPTTV
jgi:hypothetical protein